MIAWWSEKASRRGKSTLDKVLKRAFPHFVSVSDDGFDINAYAKAAAQLPHRYVVFLNTFSEIAADGWLRKLHSAFADQSVGIAGGTGSYESLLSSMKHVQKGWWLFQNEGIPKPAGLRRLFRAIRARLPKRLATRVVAAAISYFAVRSSGHDSTLDDKFETYWNNEVGPGGALARLNEISPFPNPHIRTNAFMIERQVFLDVLPDSIETKNDSYLFESGPDGLTQRILQRGLQIVVVGADGRVYGMEEWAESDTFRLGGQRNLLVKDNQTLGVPKHECGRAACFHEDDLGRRPRYHLPVGYERGNAPESDRRGRGEGKGRIANCGARLDCAAWHRLLHRPAKGGPRGDENAGTSNG